MDRTRDVMRHKIHSERHIIHFISQVGKLDENKHPICQSFLLVTESCKLYLGSHWLCLLLPVHSMLFPAVVAMF
jgi:hypothetical protein